MNIDVSKIIENKLNALESEGIIRKKIEDAVEKSITAAITSELESWSFREGIGKQIKAVVGTIADDCGLAAYNGFVATKVKDIVQNVLSSDLTDKLNKTLDDLLIRKHKNVKLSDIFDKYREWVCEHTEESEKWERRNFHCKLEIEEKGYGMHVECSFADHQLEHKSWGKEDPEIRFSMLVMSDKKVGTIGTLYLDGHYMKECYKVGRLTDFEAFICNLFYNETEIVADLDDVDDSDYFDIDV